jgi:hypothetical protein
MKHRLLTVLAFALGLATAAHADEITVNFTEQGLSTPQHPAIVFSEVPSVGTLKLTLDADDSIDATLKASQPICGFGLNGPGKVGLSDFKGSGPVPVNTGWLTYFGFYNSGFIVLGNDPSLCTATTYRFSIGGPGQFLSVDELLNNGSARRDFFLATYDSTGAVGFNELYFGGDAPVPEPYTVTLLIAGLAAMVAKRIQQRILQS